MIYQSILCPDGIASLRLAVFFISFIIFSSVASVCALSRSGGCPQKIPVLADTVF